MSSETTETVQLVGILASRGMLMAATPQRIFMVCEPYQGESEHLCYRALAISTDLTAARAQANALSGKLASYRYTCTGPVFVAEPVSGDVVDLKIVQGCEEDELDEVIEMSSCLACGAYNDDGEGYQGYCGNCADRAEAEGLWG